MRKIVAAAVLTCTMLIALAAQAPAPPAPGGRGGVASFPAQQRDPDDPVLVARGNDIYGLDGLDQYAAPTVRLASLKSYLSLCTMGPSPLPMRR